MDYKNIHKVYFVGIGGIGMSGLARFFKLQGAEVSGYDKTETPLTRQLQLEGIDVHYHDEVSLVPLDADLYVYTPAIPAEHEGLGMLKKQGVSLYKRSEVLGLLSQNFKTIAIAGTHGKTTITSMVTQLLMAANIPVNAFIGGIATNLNSNFVFHQDAEIMVVEADEYDRSFLQLHPDLAVISAIDEDHLDIYGDGNNLKETFAAFLAQLNKGGKAFLNERVQMDVPDYLSAESYGLSTVAAVKADKLRQEFGKMIFRIHFPAASTADMFLGMPGKYNVENALAAAAIAHELGVTEEQIRTGLNTYKGVKRRFEILVNTDNAVYVDDYAHHPRELEACISAAREFFPGKKLTGVFQPHLYSRTRDFADGFAQSLKLLDEIILLDIYPAREKPIPGITSAMLAEKIGDDSVFLLSKEQVLDYVKNNEPECFLTLGAGDIDQIVEPVKTIMLNQ